MAVKILSVYQYKHGAHDKWIIILYAFKFDIINYYSKTYPLL